MVCEVINCESPWRLAEWRIQGRGGHPSRSNFFIFMQFPLKRCQILDWYPPPILWSPTGRRRCETVTWGRGGRKWSLDNFVKWPIDTMNKSFFIYCYSFLRHLLIPSTHHIVIHSLILPFTHSTISPFIYLSFHPFLHSSIHLFLNSSISPFIYLFIRPSLHLSFSLFTKELFVWDLSPICIAESAG